MRRFALCCSAGYSAALRSWLSFLFPQATGTYEMLVLTLPLLVLTLRLLDRTIGAAYEHIAL
jgi:hypothetical protein